MNAVLYYETASAQLDFYPIGAEGKKKSANYSFNRHLLATFVKKIVDLDTLGTNGLKRSAVLAPYNVCLQKQKIELSFKCTFSAVTGLGKGR